MPALLTAAIVGALATVVGSVMAGQREKTITTRREDPAISRKSRAFRTGLLIGSLNRKRGSERRQGR
jgi:hypothetical protein